METQVKSVSAIAHALTKHLYLARRGIMLFFGQGQETTVLASVNPRGNFYGIDINSTHLAARGLEANLRIF
jgi:hypothetical protein